MGLPYYSSITKIITSMRYGNTIFILNGFIKLYIEENFLYGVTEHQGTIIKLLEIESKKDGEKILDNIFKALGPKNDR